MAEGGSTNQLCASGLIVPKEKGMVFRCNFTVYGRYVYIRIPEARRQLKLCEVEVYSSSYPSKIVYVHAMCIYRHFPENVFKFCKYPQHNKNSCGLIPNRNAEQNAVKHTRQPNCFSFGIDSGTWLKFPLFICLAQSEANQMHNPFSQKCVT